MDDVLRMLQEKNVVILTNYRGLNVSQMTDLRRRLRAEGIEFRVVKNSLVERAARQLEMTGLERYLVGPTAMAFSVGDPVMPVKLLAAFARESKILELKAGWIEGQLIDAAEVASLADLPGRQELVARVVGGIAAPLTGLAMVTAGPIRQLVTAINAIKEQKEAGAAA